MERQSRDEKNTSSQITKDVVGLLLGEVVSTRKTHCHKGCGWLASRRGSKYTKKTPIVAKDVVGLLVG